MRHEQYKTYQRAAGTIELDQLRRLATQLGWALKFTKSGLIEVWRREEAEAHRGEFVLPTGKHFDDYEEAILRVVEVLAEGEGIALPQMLAFLSPFTVTCDECRCDVTVSRDVERALTTDTYGRPVAQPKAPEAGVATVRGEEE
jgi:hypothetical protein